LAENTDIVAEPGTVVVESLYHVPVDALAGVKADDSLSNLSCLGTWDSEAAVVESGMPWGVSRLVTGPDETRSGFSDVNAKCSWCNVLFLR